MKSAGFYLRLYDVGHIIKDQTDSESGNPLPPNRLGYSFRLGARCSSVVRVFAHGAMGRRIDLSWGEPIELFLVPASAPRLV